MRSWGIAMTAAIGAGALMASTALAVEGDLDTTFSADGKLVYDVNQDGRAEAVATDSQGRIVVAGPVDPPGADPGDMGVARFLPDGTPDPSFSGDGFVSVTGPVANDEEDVQDLVIDPATGSIYVGGYSEFDFAVLKLTPAGIPDPGYGGGDGLGEIDGGGSESLDGISLDGAGRIVGGGSKDGNFAAARFTTAGVADNTYSGNGWVEQNVNSAASTDSATGAALDSQGRVLVGGWTRLAVGEENFAVMRFTTDGQLDASFSNDIPTPGRHIEPMSSETGGDMSDLAGGIGVAGDSPVLIGYAEITGQSENVAALKLTPAGVPDATFGTGGRAYVDLGSSERSDGMSVDSAGRAVYAARTGTSTEGSLFAGRLTTGGVPDKSFGGDGNTVAELGPGGELGNDIAIDGSGRVIAAAYVGQFATAEWGLARFQPEVKCGGKVATITGTPGKDKLKGTKKADVIAGGAGKDTISGLGGKDTLCGEDGKDTLLGGGGNDKLLGGAGKDVLKGGKGKDKLKGGAGKDKQVQ